MSPSPTTRWCPTPEQLMILEELYRRGLRTPTASQIQKITAHLSFYGNIQGKNVFYWFQNHKARDRQKLRKKLAKQLHQQHLMQPQLCPLYQHQQTHYTLTDLHYLQNPSAFNLFSNSWNSAEILHPQGTGPYEDAVPGVIMGQNWKSDLAKDCSKGTYGNDFTEQMETGPTSQPCCRNRPLQTLELFPLRSPADS